MKKKKPNIFFSSLNEHNKSSNAGCGFFLLNPQLTLKTTKINDIMLEKEKKNSHKILHPFICEKHRKHTKN